MPLARSMALALILLSNAREIRCAPPPGPTDALTPLRGLLLDRDRGTPEVLRGWKAEGGNALVLPLDESLSRQDWTAFSELAREEGLDLYAWIEVGRNPMMADAHPSWMASPGGHHDDWRRRFPKAPRAGEGESLKLWPWVPIGYAEAFQAHGRRIESLLDGLPGTWKGVFLNDLQGGPSACGCGNDQCRWTLDYGATSTTAKLPGDDAAARLVAGLIARFPGKQVIPVWVTECEANDLPAAAGGTGHCGSVPCANGACWPNYARTWAPLLRATEGPIAVALWPESFRRGPDWVSTGLSLFLRPPQGPPVSPERVIAVLSDWGPSSSTIEASKAKVKEARGGLVLSRRKLDQTWEPRVAKLGRAPR